MTQCPRCGAQLNPDGMVSLGPAQCPTCGFQIKSSSVTNWQPSGAWESARKITIDYFTDVWKILTRPAAFFKQMPTQGGVSGPLVFALIAHWIGSAMAFLWTPILGGSIASHLQQFIRFKEDSESIDSFVKMTPRLTQWLTGVGPILTDPFLSLLGILFESSLLYVSLRILVTPLGVREVRGLEVPRLMPGQTGAITFESAVRIICFAGSGAILAVIPWIGSALAPWAKVSLAVIGIREVYRISTVRSLGIYFFPLLLIIAIIGIIGLGVVIFGIIMVKLVFT